MRIYPFTDHLSLLLLDEMDEKDLTIQTLGWRLGLSQHETAHLVNGAGKCSQKERLALCEYFKPHSWAEISGECEEKDRAEMRALIRRMREKTWIGRLKKLFGM